MSDCPLVKHVKTEAQWRMLHERHGVPEKVRNVNQPPAGYTLFILKCPCGALYVTKEEGKAQ
jgi:hypothetical protein